MIGLVRRAAFFFLICGAIGDIKDTTGQNDLSTSTTSTNSVTCGPPLPPVTATAVAASAASTLGNGTCHSRTLNYITQTLPRQCLRTDRAPYNSSISSGSSSLAALSSGSDASETQISSTSDLSSPIGSSSVEVTLLDNSSTVIGTTELVPSTTVTAYPVATDVDPYQISPGSEDDADSPLDNANFLSFEEWKKQNLAKLGQSPEDVGRNHAVNPNRPRPGINNALESMGEESEIDLDFAGFGGSASASSHEGDRKSSTSEDEGSSDRSSGSSAVRSKDAGKTCKERTNYASFDCSATVLKANKECKSASAVLVESKDSYMINTCSAKNKFVIVQLCNDIQIDTIVLANYEFFSSTFRHFRVSVSDRYPVELDKWRDLGTFEGRNTREIQAFLVENPLIWAKYLRIEFLSHYGTEYYCPVTLLRVHGTTMIEDYRHDEDLARGEQLQATLEAKVAQTSPDAHESRESTDAKGQTTSEEISGSKKRDESVLAPSLTFNTSGSSPTPVDLSAKSSHATEVPPEEHVEAQKPGLYEPWSLNTTCDNPAVDQSSEPEHADIVSTVPTSDISTSSTTLPTDIPQPSHIASKADVSQDLANTTAPSVTDTILSANESHTRATTHEKSSSSTVTDSTSSVFVSTLSVQSSSPAAGSSQSTAAPDATRQTASSSSTVQPPQPSNQESFYKSFHKRLQQLESNSTLSLKYIEEQSRILRDAFTKVEKRQISSTSRFLSQLNATVMAELHGFRQAYDQLWQGTVIELEGQRETYQREMLALSSRLTMVADELVWQKRMGIVQSTLLLLCLAMALFGRSADGYLEVPLMQQIAALKSGWESPPDSPSSPKSRSPVSLFRRRIWRSKTDPAGDTRTLTDSETSRPQTKEGPGVHVQPPSPMSHDPPSDHGGDYFKEKKNDTSAVVQDKDAASPESPASPKRNRKKPKKPPNSPQGNGRLKSPLAI